jgi:hypothetical protein
MSIFIGDSESLRMQHRDQSRLRGLISIALNLCEFRAVRFRLVSADQTFEGRGFDAYFVNV